MSEVATERVFPNQALRIEKYEIIDHLNNVTNIILASFPQCDDRDNLLSEVRRLKEMANNL